MLKAATLYPVDKQVDISVACCVLHNFIRLHNGDMSWVRNAPLEIDPLQIVDVPSGDHSYNYDVGAFNNSREEGNRKRDYIAHKMWEDYIASRRA